MAQHIVGHGDEGVFLDKHLAVLHHDGQAVDIGVYHKAYIGAALLHEVGDLGEVFGNRFGGVGEFAGGLAVEFNDVLHSERAQQLGYDDAADRVDSVDRHGESGFADGLGVDQFQVKYLLDMTAVPGCIGEFVAESHDIDKLKFLGFGDSQNLFSFRVVEKLSVFIEKLEGVPLRRVV